MLFAYEFLIGIDDDEALAEISSVEEVFLETSAIDGAAGHRRSARGRSSRRRRGTRLLK